VKYDGDFIALVLLLIALVLAWIGLFLIAGALHGGG
jgi:hypothetical protein